MPASGVLDYPTGIQNIHSLDVQYIQSCFFHPQTIPADGSKELYELYFVFACVWAFGSSLYYDGTLDYRAEFSKWWQNEYKTVRPLVLRLGIDLPSALIFLLLGEIPTKWNCV